MYSIYTALIIWMCTGAGCAYFATQRNRNPIAWFFIGLILGVLGLILILLLPPVTQEPKSTPMTVPDIHNEAAVPRDSSHSYEPPPKRIPYNTGILWYYLDEKLNAIGPLTLNNLRKELHQKPLDTSTYIWCEEFDDWCQIHEFQNSSLLTDPDLID